MNAMAGDVMAPAIRHWPGQGSLTSERLSQQQLCFPRVLLPGVGSVMHAQGRLTMGQVHECCRQ